MKKKPKALLLSSDFRYTNAEDSRRPGYLAKRMAAYAKAQKPALPPVASVVRKLRG